MSRYHQLLGRRVDVEYRAGDIILPATGTLAADSGRSIFLEEKLMQRGREKTFRWEIPYPFLLAIRESATQEPPASGERELASTSESAAPERPAADSERNSGKENAATHASSLLPLRHRSHEA